MPRPHLPPHQALRLATASGLAAALLAACASSPTRGGTPRPTAAPSQGGNRLAAASPAPSASPSPTTNPVGGDLQASASPSPKADPSATPVTPLLPLRLGLALPASLVGQAAQSRLVGSKEQGALIAPEGSRLVALADGRILSNHAAGLISDHGGGLISDHGGGLVGNNSGGLVGNNGGTLVANNGSGLIGQGAGYRLAQAEAMATNPVQNASTGGGPTYLWLVLALLDQQDQLLQAFAASGPRLGSWRRFGAEGAKVLPPPDSAADFAVAIAQMDAQLRQQHYAGVLTQDADGPRLRMLWLPKADSPLSEGRPLMDYQASGTGRSVRARFVPALEDAFGLAESAARFDFSQGPLGAVVDGLVGERYLPYAQQSLVAKAINGTNGHSANRRRLHLAAQSTARSVATVSRGMIHPGDPQIQRRDLYAFGFASPGQADAGLAYVRRVAYGPVGQVGPFSWVGPNDVWLDGEATPPPVHFVLPSGERVASAPALAGLIPSLPTPVDRDVPAAIAPGEDPSQDANLRILAWPSGLLALPEAP